MAECEILRIERRGDVYIVDRYDPSDVSRILDQEGFQSYAELETYLRDLFGYNSLENVEGE